MAPGENYQCSACKKNIKENDLSVMCDSDCSSVFHLKCTELKEPVFRMIKEHESITWSCQQCVHAKKTALVQCVQQVADLASQVEALKIKVLEHENVINSDTYVDTNEVNLFSSILKKPQSAKVTFNKPKTRSSSSNSNNLQQREVLIKQRPIVQKLQPKLLELDEQSENNKENDDFQKVINPRRRAITKVVGTADLINKPGKLQAVARRAHVHVWRLEKTTTSEDMENHLHNILDSKDICVEKLDSRGDYASFKISVDFGLLDKIYDPQIWPKYASVSRFRFPTNRAKSQNLNQDQEQSSDQIN